MVDVDTLLTTLYVMVDDFCHSHLPTSPTAKKPGPKPRCVQARSSPWPSSLGGDASVASGTSTATQGPACAMLFPPCQIAHSATASCAATRSSSSVSSCTWSLCWTGKDI